MTEYTENDRVKAVLKVLKRYADVLYEPGKDLFADTENPWTVPSYEEMATNIVAATIPLYQLLTYLRVEQTGTERGKEFWIEMADISRHWNYESTPLEK